MEEIQKQYDEWQSLKQYIAYNIIRYSKDYDRNLMIYCDAISYSELKLLIKLKILPELSTHKDLRGTQQLLDALEEGNEFQDTLIVYENLKYFINQNDNKHVGIITGEIRKFLKQKQSTNIPIPSIMYKLGKTYNLSEEELKIISILYLWHEWYVLNDALNYQTEVDFYRILSGLCHLNTTRLTWLTCSKSNLRNMGLINSVRRFATTTLVEVSTPLLLAINSKDLDVITSELFKKRRKSRYKPEQFSVSQMEKEFIYSVLKGNKAVLISGDPGIGKTEFAYGVAEHLGKVLVELNSDTSSFSYSHVGSQPHDKLIMVRIASNLIQKDKEVLLIDEADALLQSAGGMYGFSGGEGSYDKAALNSLLEEIHIPTIWITNSIERIPSSSLRRFAYVYNFPHPDMNVRSRMLKEKFISLKNNLFTELIQNISMRYDLTPSAMERMVNVTRGAAEENQGNKTLSVFVENYLESASKGPLKHDFRKLPSVSESFNPNLCSTSVPLDKIISLIKGKSVNSKPVRILFEGSPGGGKTQFSLYIAAVIGREAVLKKPSDLLSPFLGSTEENIKTMFREAELSRSVLILDEADSLFIDRSSAQRSWELSQASEFLQGIQNFKGILIACTNRFENLDPAIRRRFHQRVTFGALSKNLIEKVLKHLFPDTIFSNRQIDMLKNTSSLMMSDFANAAEILDIEDFLDPDIIIKEIIENSKNRNTDRVIGF